MRVSILNHKFHRRLKDPEGRIAEREGFEVKRIACSRVRRSTTTANREIREMRQDYAGIQRDMRNRQGMYIPALREKKKKKRRGAREAKERPKRY